jgi:hypothetical protein
VLAGRLAEALTEYEAKREIISRLAAVDRKGWHDRLILHGLEPRSSGAQTQGAE